MNNYIKINFKGKEYIGQIENINSQWQISRNTDNTRNVHLVFYNVCIIEKDTNVTIKDIIIKSFSEIKPYIL